MRILVGLVTALILAASASAASAAPLIYTYEIDNQSGTLVGTPFAAATVTIQVVAESTTLSAQTVFGLGGQCVTGSSGTVAVNGGAPVAITQQLYVCQANSGNYLGVYPDLGTLTASHFDLPIVGVDLAVPGGPYPAPAAQAHNGISLTVTGGTYVFGPSYTNTAASFFSIAPAVAPTTVPTMTEWAMILFGLILAGGAAMMIQRRRFTV